MSRRGRVWLVLALVAVVGWGGWLIARSTVVVGAAHARTFCLFDDAMISMTYARNLVEGQGLAWARHGAPVEGFTHPLWLLPMLAANVLPLPLRLRSLPVQVVSLLLLAGAALAAWRLVRTHFAVPSSLDAEAAARDAPGARHALPALLLTGFYFPLAYWSVLGMETALQSLLALLCVQLALDAVEGGRARHLLLWVLCAASYLLRMDMLLLVVVVQAYVLWRRGVRGRQWRAWAAGAAIFAAAAGGYEVFRWAYYHDLLPNTYYLKMTGVPLVVRLHRGIVCLGGFARGHALLLVLGAASLAAWRRLRGLELCAALFVTYAAYVVWVGGDAWEDIGIRADRFIAFVMPLLFVIVDGGWNAAVARWRARTARGARAAPPTAAGVGAAALTAALTLLLLVACNGLWPGAAGAQQARWMSGIDRPPLVDEHQEVLDELEQFQAIVRPPATVAVAWAGLPAYFSDYRLLDLLGYNDRELARMPSSVTIDAAHWQRFWPGHNKWNVDWALRRRPDAFFQVWGPRMLGERVADVMRVHGYRRVDGFWVRLDSPWVALPAGARARRRGVAAQGDVTMR